MGEIVEVEAVGFAIGEIVKGEAVGLAVGVVVEGVGGRLRRCSELEG